MLVVIEGDGCGVLHRPGHHEAGVAAHGGQVADKLGVAGEEADPHPGEVRSLRERVDRYEPVEPVLEHRPAGAVPGELRIALVGEDRHAVRAPPGGDCGQILELAGRVARRVHP